MIKGKFKIWVKAVKGVKIMCKFWSFVPDSKQIMYESIMVPNSVKMSFIKFLEELNIIIGCLNG